MPVTELSSCNYPAARNFYELHHTAAIEAHQLGACIAYVYNQIHCITITLWAAKLLKKNDIIARKVIK